MLLLKSNIMSPIAAQNQTTMPQLSAREAKWKVVKIHVSLYFESIFHVYMCFCFSNASNSSVTLNDLIMDTSIISTEYRWMSGGRAGTMPKAFALLFGKYLIETKGGSQG